MASHFRQPVLSLIVLAVPALIYCQSNVRAFSPSPSAMAQTGGTVWAWGANSYGQLGNGTTTESTLPVQVLGLTSVTAIAGGSSHSLALKTDGTAWAWGSNEFGELGNGTLTASNVPLQVSSLTGVTAIAGGSSYSLALNNNGAVWAWGINIFGELGDGTWIDSYVPVQVSGLTGVTAIAGGDVHALALKNDGTVWAWGWNEYGQLGNGTWVDSNVPLPVSELTNVTAIAGGGMYSLAMKSDGTVWAWGRNDSGQLGNGTWIDSNVPLPVSSFTEVTAIATNGGHSLALRTDSTAWAWGSNEFGQLGNGTLTNSNVPVQVSGLAGVNAIAGGAAHSLALKSDGTVWAWGYNEYGELGNGTLTNSSVPVPVLGLGSISTIAGGSVHSLALLPPMSVIASATPTEGVAPLTVNFTSSVSGGTPPYTYIWSFGDGGSTGEKDPTHTYTLPDTNLVTLTVTDSALRTATDTHLSISVHGPLSAQASADFTGGVAPLWVNFTGIGSGGTPPYTYAWAFGDGGTSPIQNPAHVYSSPGTYSATLTVTDASSMVEAGLTVVVFAQPCGVQWQLVSSDKPEGTAQDFAYNGSRYVCVTYDAIFSSDDSTTWTLRMLLAGWYEQRRVSYGGGLFVVVGGSTGVIYTSPDGISWTPITLPRQISLLDCAYGNGIWVIGGYDFSSGGQSYCYTSRDGVVWAEFPIQRKLWRITYGLGQFAATEGGPSVYVSNDGVRWSGQGSTSFPIRSLIFGGGLYVAVGQAGRTSRSPEGQFWTNVQTETQEDLTAIGYSNGLFVVFGGNGTMLLSNDAVTWFRGQIPFSWAGIYSAEVIGGTYEWLVAIADWTFHGSLLRSACAPPCTLSCSTDVPSMATTNATVPFKATGALGTCSGNISYQWTFGDGTTSTEKDPSHAYASSGIYSWSMTASASGGLCPQSGSITIVDVVPPAITSVSALKNPFRLKIAGSNFHPGCTVRINGTPVTTTWKSATQVVAKGCKPLVPKDVQVFLTVVNIDDGGVSQPFTFTR